MSSFIQRKGKFRKLLQRLPDSVRAEIGHVMQDAGRRILRIMQARSPRRSGRFAGGLEMRFSPKVLNLRIGFFRKRRRLTPWYARIVENGRKAKIVNVTRRIARFRGKRGTRLRGSTNGSLNAGTFMGSAYLIRVKQRAPAKVVTGRYGDLRRELGRSMRQIWGRALGRVAGGGA